MPMSEGFIAGSAKLLEMAKDYGFGIFKKYARPLSCQTKGKVERLLEILLYHTVGASHSNKQGLALDVDTANAQVGN
ncbi:MAG: hypothetical protein IPO71_11970 [Nitrosomonas sp.]|nr:hypothetical protein [Nitrosomonas sp.]